jgi:3-oxoacyl-[acyl-carrier protein] reductase
MNLGKLTGQVAVVTGASRGIGAAVAERLANDGASVAVNFNASQEAADALVEKIVSNGGRAMSFKANVFDPVQATALVDWTSKTFGSVDIVVNNASGNPAIAPLGTIDEAHVEAMILHNINGPIHVTQAALDDLSRSKSGGRVINMSGIAAHHALPGLSVYAAAKAAISALTRTWALELGSRGITVNGVAPGPVDTEMYRSFDIDDEAKNFLLSRHPLGRIGQPDDIADIIAFLASPDARWVTGQVIDSAGGFLP